MKRGKRHTFNYLTFFPNFCDSSRHTFFPFTVEQRMPVKTKLIFYVSHKTSQKYIFEPVLFSSLLMSIQV